MCLTTTVLFVYYLSMAIENVSHHDCLLELSEEDWRAVHRDLLPLPEKNIYDAENMRVKQVKQEDKSDKSNLLRCQPLQGASFT